MKRSNNKNNKVQISIGEQLKKLRFERDLSIREMSTICGLAVNTLSLIENGKSIPTIKTLQNIAYSLKIPITSFFEDSQNTYIVDSVKNLDRIKQSTPYGDIYSLVSDGYCNTSIEPYVINIFPNTTWGTDKISQPGYEFVFCINGMVSFLISNTTYSLNEGDSILFHTQEPHIWNNPTKNTSRILFILFPLEYQEKRIQKYL